MNKNLVEYKRKRDFQRTPEPEASNHTAQPDPIFVVQKHAARRLHYDFRLEVDGVLKSWAVPKGPSPDPNEKRLAVQVEDHPLDYATFEGVIPERNYGAGPVIVWDYGTYSPDDNNQLSFGDPEEAADRMRKQIEDGKISIWLKGAKLRGSWTLVKTRGKDGNSDAQWLLIKHKDAYAGVDISDEASVISRRTIEQVIRGVQAPQSMAGTSSKAVQKPFPKAVSPMFAKSVAKPFSDPAWLFEPKLDGVRAIAYIRDGKTVLRSRRGLDITSQYPEIVSELAGLANGGLVLDGEIVAINESGVPDFQLLQNRLYLNGSTANGTRQAIPILYYVFDLLYSDGYDLTRVPLEDRQRQLRAVCPPSDNVLVVDSVPSDGQTLYKIATSLGLEGMVAKRRDGIYEPGQRSSSWLKIKSVLEQEFVVCGYLPGQGHRQRTFGALLLGYYEDGQLHFASSVGSGFTDKELAMLLDKLEAIETDVNPFDEPIPRQKEAPLWVKPSLVVRVKFSSWTNENYLRAPVYVGLRDDIDPSTVTRESVEAAPSTTDIPTMYSADQTSSGLLEQLENARDSMTVTAEGYEIKLTNLNKELWPAVGKRPAFTKRDLIRYYVSVSEYVLPHLQERPMNLTRYPNGINGQSFYQKHVPDPVPDFVSKVKLYSSHLDTDSEYIIVQNVPTLAWLAQLGVIELHPWLSRVNPEPDALHLPTTFEGSEANIDASTLNYPDFIIFDLDPYIYSGKEKTGEEPELNKSAYQRVRQAALTLKSVLEDLGLVPFVKTSGKTGLHIYVPVVRQYDYDVIRQLCATIGKFLQSLLPTEITMEWTVGKRTGKIFFDHNQNSRGKTLAAPYSLRPSTFASVSTPIAWDELMSVYPTDFTIATVPARLQKNGDPWRDILNYRHDLQSLINQNLEDKDA